MKKICIGKFAIYDNFSNKKYLKEINYLFSMGIIIVDMKRDWETKTVMYTGIWDGFEEIQEGEEIPYYDIVYDIDCLEDCLHINLIRNGVYGVPHARSSFDLGFHLFKDSEVEFIDMEFEDINTTTMEMVNETVR